MGNAYGAVAGEYYDESRHPTCAALRKASVHGLGLVSKSFLASGGRFLEVGCGAGMLGELVPMARRLTIVGIDLNWSMLEHSTGVVAQADAFHMPFPASTFDGVFGSLADPYNVPQFWSEALRLLRPHGRLLFTVPDVRWTRHNQTNLHEVGPVAELQLTNGDVVPLPSHVYEHDEQISLLEEAGFATVTMLSIPAAAVAPSGVLSPRFYRADGELVSPNVVTLYMAAASGEDTSASPL